MSRAASIPLCPKTLPPNAFQIVDSVHPEMKRPTAQNQLFLGKRRRPFLSHPNSFGTNALLISQLATNKDEGAPVERKILLIACADPFSDF